MAYAAVVSLLQVLEKVLVAIRMKFPNSLRELNKLIGSQASAIDDMIGILSDASFNSNTLKLLEKKSQILEWIKYLEKDLDRCFNIESDNDLSFVCEVSLETTVLCQDLRFLLTNLDEFSTIKPDDHRLLQCITDAADRARDVFEESLDKRIKSAMNRFTRSLFQVRELPASSSTWFGNADMGTLRGIQSIKGGIQSIEEEISSIKEEMKIPSIKEKIPSIEGEIQSIEEKIQSIKGEIQSIKEKISSIKEEIEIPSIKKEIQSIKEEIQSIKSIKEEIQSIKEEIQSILAQNQAISGSTIYTNDEIPNLESSTISLRDSNKEETVVGFDDFIGILDGLTGRPPGLEIVTIVGMGGIGKTTLAKQLFNHPYTVYHFYCRAWITVSQVYQVRDLLLGLLSSIAQRIDKMTEKSDAQLAEHLYRSLKGKRYLIVLDDMWSMDVWNDLKRCFPNDKNGSRIIVTSRFTELAKYVSPNKAPHLMNLLDTEKSWELLEKLVFGTASCSSELVEVGKQIAKRCGGLPLAIVVIAGILSRTTRTLDSWKPIAENVSSIMSSDPEQCLDILALSYIYLPHHLRACFLYMGAFPEDCEIETQKLINLWVAEDFLYSDCPKNLEQTGEEYLEELIGRNLVLVERRHFGGKVKTCRLHDFIRELCLREAQKENFMNVVVQRGGSSNFPSGMRNQHRLSFHSDPFSDVTEPPTLPRVSTFLCFTLGSAIVPDILFFQLEFKLLRVLDMYFLRFEYFPEQVIMLIHLRYLALNVTFELPETICQLRNLQTFVIQGPWPSRESGSSPTLLLKYLSMPSLRHLHCSVASQLSNPSIHQNEFPGSPEHLQTLSTIRFSSCKKEVFAIMPRLKRLGICETKDEYSTDRSCFPLSSLIFLQELETLNCCFYVQNREPRRLPRLFAFPSTLRHLSLSWSYLPWEDMTPISMLPNLEVLKLKNYAFQGPDWVPAEEGFRSLKHLLIEKTNLVYWEATVHQFPCLQNLILKYCKRLKEIPFGVEGIGSLHRIELHYCSEHIENLAKEIQEQIEGIDVVIRSDRTPDSA